MTESPPLQAYLNCLELCRAFKKQTGDPYVREALDSLIDGLQESLASLASHLRQQGAAPGAYELDRQGKAKIRDVLAKRSLAEQLFAIRASLADLVAWYAAHPPDSHPNQATHDWLVSLSDQAHRLLEAWDRHMREMKAAKF